MSRDRRAAAVAVVTERLCGVEAPHPVRVAVDGITASGKSTLARELTSSVAAAGRPVIHLSMDGFHQPRERRHRRGRLSARGYYDDAYDFAGFTRHVLIPLGPGGDLRYRARIIDLDTDRRIDEDARTAPADAVVIVDGSFLQRPELAVHWDQTVFVNTSFPTARARGLARDADRLGGPEPAGLAFDQRYHAAARLYLDAVHPDERATVVVDNDDLDSPRVHLR